MLPLSPAPTRKVHGFVISHKIPIFSSFKTNGFLVSSFSIDNSFDYNQVCVNSSLDDTTNEPQV